MLSIKEKTILKFLFWSFGIIITLIPFVIFDLRHPPGLFLTRILYSSPVESSFSASEIFSKAFVWFQYMLNYYTQSAKLSLALGLSILLLLILDIKTHFKAVLFALPWIAQIIGLIFINNPCSIYYYYLLPSTIPFLVWILYPRQNNYLKALTNIMFIILLVGGLISIIPKMTQTTWQTDIKSVRKINSLLSEEIRIKDLKNVNIAVLESPDNNT